MTSIQVRLEKFMLSRIKDIISSTDMEKPKYDLTDSETVRIFIAQSLSNMTGREYVVDYLKKTHPKRVVIREK